MVQGMFPELDQYYADLVQHLDDLDVIYLIYLILVMICLIYLSDVCED